MLLEAAPTKRRVAPKHLNLAGRIDFHSADGDAGCRNWTAGKDNSGYGLIFVDGKQRRAHRVSYEVTKGPIPDGLVIDHLCRNTSCVNPAHLEAVTVQENTLRGVSTAAAKARQTHCENGHPLEGDNLSLDHRGHRRCLTCQRAHVRKWKRTKAGPRDFKKEWADRKALSRARALRDAP